MKNKKIDNIFKKIVSGILTIITITSLVNLLIPGMYSLFTSLLGISINLLSGVVIGGGILGIIVSLGLIAKCIKIKTEYIDINKAEQDPNLIRQNLSVVNFIDKDIEKENTPNNKYSYVYDNEYTDVEDIEIDDITNPNWLEEYNPIYQQYTQMNINRCNDNDVKIYTRKKK